LVNFTNTNIIIFRKWKLDQIEIYFTIYGGTPIVILSPCVSKFTASINFTLTADFAYVGSDWSEFLAFSVCLLSAVSAYIYTQAAQKLKK
jgi:hypothetical protein